MVQVRTNIKAMFISVHGVKLWNTLPDDIKNYTSANIFKKCLKKNSYHTIRLVYCNKLIIYTAVFAIDQSKIMVILYNHNLVIYKQLNLFRQYLLLFYQKHTQTF